MSELQKINELVYDTARDLDLRIVHLSVSTGRRLAISLLIERLDDAPIDIEDCSNAHQHLNLRLKVDNIVSSPFTLEVSSPGIDRPLFNVADYIRFSGKEVEVKLKAAADINGKKVKNFKGNIIKIQDEEIIHFEADNYSQFVVHISMIKEARLAISKDLIKQTILASRPLTYN